MSTSDKTSEDFLRDLGNRPQDTWTGTDISRLFLIAIGCNNLRPAPSADRAHVHRCMSCGESWFCPHPPDDCKAGENAFPSLTLRGPNGQTVFHHACPGKK